MWQVYAFLVFASGYRRRRSLTDPDVRGQSRDVLVLFVAMLSKHVVPTLYPGSTLASRKRGRRPGIEDGGSVGLLAGV